MNIDLGFFLIIVAGTGFYALNSLWHEFKKATQPSVKAYGIVTDPDASAIFEGNTYSTPEE